VRRDGVLGRASWACKLVRSDEEQDDGDERIEAGVADQRKRPAFSGSDFFEKFCASCSSNWAEIEK
jgi:hypothetical protein